jgi:LacI family transcriptional regulator
MVTMKEVAARAGVSVSTVSRSLSNRSSIAPDTRQRIQAIAREIGYCPNPLLATLMTGIRERRPPSGANMACLHEETKGTDIFPMHSEFLEGVRSAARRLNYNIDLFESASEGLNERELARIWKARNIRGIILSNLRCPRPSHFPWNEFAWVLNGHTTGVPPLHRVGNEIYQVMKSSVAELARRGYSRPGLVLPLQGSSRAGFRWPAGLIGNLLRYGLKPSLNRIFTGEWLMEAFKGWFLQERPDIIMALSDEPLLWLEQMGVKVPEDAGFLHLAANISSRNPAGVAQNFRAAGEAAIYSLDSALRRNERGIPPVPAVFTVAGTWRDGATLRSIPGNGRSAAFGRQQRGSDNQPPPQHEHLHARGIMDVIKHQHAPTRVSTSHDKQHDRELP